MMDQDMNPINKRDRKAKEKDRKSEWFKNLKLKPTAYQ